MKNTIVTITGLTLLSGAFSLIPAQAQTKKPAARKPAPSGGPIVLGTTQLPGDFGQLGTTYTIGKSEPINFTLKSAEYTVEPYTVGNNNYVPKGDQKLLLLRYTVYNPIPKEQSYGWHSLRFTAVDARDTNQDYIQAVKREGTSEPLSIQLKPAQKLDVVAVILVPAEGVVPKLIVEREKNAPVIRYDLRGKVKSLPEPVADSADTSGATARKEVPARAGTFYPIGVFDARLDEVAYTSQTLEKHEPGKGKRFLTAVFTLKNRTASKQTYYWGYFLASLRDGEKVPFVQMLLKASRDEYAKGELEPGEEGRIRLIFRLPENVAGKSVNLAEGIQVDARAARVFAFDVSSASAPAAATTAEAK